MNLGMKKSMTSRGFPTFRKLMNAMKNNKDSSQVFKQNHRTKYRERILVHPNAMGTNKQKFKRQILLIVSERI